MESRILLEIKTIERGKLIDKGMGVKIYIIKFESLRT